MIRLEKSSTKIVEKYFMSNDTVIVPMGATESHGFHNPLGTDTQIPNKILDLMEELDVLVVPTLPYGSSDGHMGFSGSITLSDSILIAVLESIVDSLYKHGARKFIFLNGHGGNTPAIRNICLKLSQKNAQGVILDWWRMIGEINPDWAGGHGDKIETSANMFIDESCVDLNQIEDLDYKNLSDNLPATFYNVVEHCGISYQVPRLTSMGSNQGWFGPKDPRESTAKLGKDMLTTISKCYIGFIKEFMDIKL